MEARSSMGSESVMVPWSDLPNELVERISKFLDTQIDVLRVRAVCNSWRSSLPPNFKISKSLPLIKLPIPNMIRSYNENSEFYLIESTVYLFQLIASPTSPSPSPHTGWLVKVVKTLDGKLRILNPLTHRLIKVLPDNMPNLLDFRVSQVCKSYHVQREYDEYDVGSFFRKILLIWSDQTNHFSLMAIGIWHHLFCLKSGDEKWTRLEDFSRKIADIIVYKGNFYAVDQYGETIKYDPSSFSKTNVSSTIKYDSNKVSSSLFNEWGSKKRLVESGGQLFLVDMFLDIDVKRELRGSGPFRRNPMEIKIHRLDEEQHEWIAVHTLGDQIFFAGDDCCFSVSSLDFGDPCRGNCVYYENGGIIMDILGQLPPKYYDDYFEDDLNCSRCRRYRRSVHCGFSPIPVDGGVKHSSNDGKIDKNDLGSKSSGGLSEELKLRYKGLHGHHTGIFTLQDGKLSSLLSCLEYADIFWPPPSWLNTEDQAASSDAHN